jgi:acyl carrier protein
MQSQPALAAMEYLLGTDVAQAIIAEVDWQVFIPTYETGRKQPLLEYMGAGLSKRAQPTGTQQAELQQRLEQATHAERQVLLEQYIQAEVNSVMGFAPSSPLNPQQNLFELGIDSLMALSLETRLERSLGRAFPATVPFDYPTVAALARCLNDLF